MEKILVIYGGTRRRENTEKLLDKVIEGITISNANIDKIILKELNISPCISCYGCSKNGDCSINDDMSGLYDKLKAADIIILASPIYFGSVSAYTKIMIDRCQAFWSGKYIAKIKSGERKKRGYFIATAGSDDENVILHAGYTVKLFFAACNAAYSGELFVNNTDNIKVDNNTGELDRAAAFGRAIANIL